MASKWDAKYTLLVTAIARNIGMYGIQWDKVAEELEDSPKACESAFWRLDKEREGQASVDARIIKHRIKNVSYARMLPDFPGYTIGQLKDRAAKLAGQSNNKWVDEERVGFLDIETSNLSASIGIMLSWSLKLKDGGLIHDCISRDEAIDRDKQDKRLVQSLIDALDNVDLIVGYYSTGFDIPFIRSRAMYWRIKDCLGYGDKMHLDLYYIVKHKMKLHSSSLAVATEFLGIDGKNRIPPKTWADARLGYDDALEYVMVHNDEDVLILEGAYNELVRYKKVTRKSV